MEENGWTQLPNGLIFQWGKAGGSGINTYITFPKKFTKKYFLQEGNSIRSTPGDSGFNYSSNASLTGFLFCYEVGALFYWYAIGI